MYEDGAAEGAEFRGVQAILLSCLPGLVQRSLVSSLSISVPNIGVNEQAPACQAETAVRVLRLGEAQTSCVIGAVPLIKERLVTTKA